MKMQLPIHVPEEITIEDSASVAFQKLSQTHKSPLQKNDSCVPDSHMKFIVQKSQNYWIHKGFHVATAPKPAIYYLHYQPAKIYLIHLL